jgi:hypothetical protein
VRTRLLVVVLALAALVVAGASFSGAAFVGASANPGNSFATAASFSSVTMTDPGANLRGTVTLGATTTGAIVSVTIQRSPAGLDVWTDVCTDATSPYSCSFDTTTVLDGLYDLRATADDGQTTITSTVVASRRVDNTGPTGVTMSDPGSPIAGSVTFSGSALDTGSGMASLAFQYSPAGLGSWADACSDVTSPYSCSFDTTALLDGLYDFRSLATDVAGNQSASSAWTSRRVDNYFPTSTMTDPGAYLRGTVTLGATASDGGGILSVVIQRSPAGLDTWTDVCTDTTSPYSCSFDTITVADGLYDFRAVATDNASRATVSSTVANRRVDNTAPAASLTDPGANLHLTVTLDATASDTGGSGVANVTIQRSPAGLDTWTDICTDTASPYSCSFDTATVADGLYDLRAVSIDNAANATVSTVVANRTVDNTAPTAVDIQTTNGGATAGRAEANDTITFTYSEAINPASILAGWNGSSQAVTVRLVQAGGGDRLEVWNATNTALLPLTSTYVSLSGNYTSGVGGTIAATMVRSGASITITFGVVVGSVLTETANGTMSWPPSATATDLAGNACATTAASESGAADREF